MNPSVQYFNKPMMYGSPFSIDSNMVNRSHITIPGEPMGFNTPGNMISMEFIPSPIGFNNGRYGPIITANNGIMYFVSGILPYRVLKIDPSTNIITTIYDGSLLPGFGGRRLLLSPTGTIIPIPLSATTVGEFDPVTETFSSFGTVPGGSNKYWGGVLANNSKIYCPPLAGGSILVIDVINRSTYTIGSFGGGNKWGAPRLAPNGKIYCPPFADNRVLVIDPKDDSFYFLKDDINNLAGSTSNKYFTSTLAYDGKIYCIGAVNTLVIDPETDTCSSFSPFRNGNLLGTMFPNTGILGTNGKIYGSYYNPNGLQNNNVRIREFDPYTRTYSSIGIPESLNQIVLSTSGGSPGAYGGTTIAPNGKMYFTPQGSNFFGIVCGLPPATPEMWQLPKDLSKLSTSLFNYHSNGNGI